MPLNNRITGNSRRNQIMGGKGNDTLTGGGGPDDFIFKRGDGQDVITDVDTSYILQRFGRPSDTIWRDENGVTDVEDYSDNYGLGSIQFSQGVNHDQLWFQKIGQDLVIKTIGTTDSISLKNWYLADHTIGANSPVIKASDGKVLSYGIESLVSAMSAFSPPTSGQTTLPANYQTALSTVMAANWH